MEWVKPSIGWTAILVFVFWLIPTPIETRAGEILNQEKIQSILDEMDDAIRKRDANGHIQFMAPDVSIQVTLKDENGTHQMRFTREEYRLHLIEAFGVLENYSFSRSTLNIQIENGGSKATAVTHIVEKIITQGVRLQSVTREISKFELIKGKIWFTALEAVSQVEKEQDFST
jgi:ketosteroid isomerase-like protein